MKKRENERDKKTGVGEKEKQEDGQQSELGDI